MCLMPYANNKGADQPAHPRSLISTFVVRCLDSIMPLVSKFEMHNRTLSTWLVLERASKTLGCIIFKATWTGRSKSFLV